MSTWDYAARMPRLATRHDIGACESCGARESDGIKIYNIAESAPFPLEPYYMCENCSDLAGERADQDKASGGGFDWRQAQIDAWRLK